MFFGNPFEKPATPQVKAARDYLKRNQSRFDDLSKLTDAELDSLESEADNLVTAEERMRLYAIDTELAGAYSGAKAAIKGERTRRQQVRFSEWLRRDRATATVNGLLVKLATSATGAESVETAKELGLTASDVLGTEPPSVSKVTAAAAAKMTDEELAAAIREAHEQAHEFSALVSGAGDIQSVLDYLAPLARELKRRQPILEKCRELGSSNLATLTAEQSRRAAQRREERAKLDEAAAATPEVIAQILARLDNIEGAS